MRQLDTYSATLPDGTTETRQSSRALRLAVVVASTAGVRAGQLEASIAAHRAEALADLRNDGIRHDSRKEARRVAGIRDAETVRDVERLEELRALPEDALVEASVWGWYPTAAAAEKGLAGAATLYPVAEIVSLDVVEAGPDTPGGKVGVVFPTDVMFNSPNAADKPGGTDQGDNIMAKHINTATVRTANGEVVLTKTSTHRSYVVASGFEMTDGTQLLAAWHLTEEAGRKAIASAAMLREAGRREAKTILIPVEVEVKYTKAELAAQAAEAAEAEGVELEVVETARPSIVAPVEFAEPVVLSGEMTEAQVAEVAEIAAENEARQDAEIVEETTVEVPAAPKARKARKVVEAEAPDAVLAPVGPGADAPVKWGMGEHKVGDVVKSKDGLEWTVAGPAEKGKTVRLERTVDGAVKVRLSFHYNITKA